MAHPVTMGSPPAGLDALTQSDFLSNAKSQLDADHFGLDKVKRRLIEYCILLLSVSEL